VLTGENQGDNFAIGKLINDAALLQATARDLQAPRSA